MREKPIRARLFQCIQRSLLLCVTTLASTGYCQRTVEIATEIFEYRIDDEHQMGIFHDWEHHRGDLLGFSVALPGAERVGDAPLAGVDLNMEALNVLWGVARTRLLAAVRDGSAILIGNPTIIALEGAVAQIVSGESFPVTEFEGKGTVQKLKERKVDTGVKLYVTPAVYREEYVILSIQAESSEIREQFVEFVTSEGRRYELPQISKRIAQTVVILRSGQSLFIGGLYQESYSEQSRFIPGLASIPVLGRAFRGSNRKTVTAETIFKITPTILETGEGSSFYQRLLGRELPQTAPQPSLSQILPTTPDASVLSSSGSD